MIRAWIELVWGLAWMIAAQYANNKAHTQRHTRGMIATQSDDEMLSAVAFWLPIAAGVVLIVWHIVFGWVCFMLGRWIG